MVIDWVLYEILRIGIQNFVGRSLVNDSSGFLARLLGDVRYWIFVEDEERIHNSSRLSDRSCNHRGVQGRITITIVAPDAVILVPPGDSEWDIIPQKT